MMNDETTCPLCGKELAASQERCGLCENWPGYCLQCLKNYGMEAGITCDCEEGVY
ncbi:MAG: hypothetical protein P4L50_01890 [Anaerolineaceae bacterium]|nr:hypothetical protein [Anaerolineaceae bacterium]